MEIINFVCVECSEARDRYFPPVTFESITEAYSHALENHHKVVIMKPEPDHDED